MRGQEVVTEGEIDAMSVANHPHEGSGDGLRQVRRLRADGANHPHEGSGGRRERRQAPGL